MRFQSSHFTRLAPTFALAVRSIFGLHAQASTQEAPTLQAPVEANSRFDLEARLHEGECPLAAHDAVRLASGHSPRAEVMPISIRAAEASARRATAALVPRLDLSARYTHVDGFPDGRIGGSSNPEAIARPRSRQR